MEFINCKVEEEKKAWALIDAGYDGSFTGTAYTSVFFQNSNNSVRVTDDFMRAVLDDGDWSTRRRDRRCRRRDLQGARADARHCRGHLGLRRSWHAVRHHCERVHLSRNGPDQRQQPVLEIHVLDDSACNLASINLMKFVKEDGEFDIAGFKAACRTLITAQEIIVPNSALSDQGDREEPRTSIVRSVSATPTSARC